MKTKITIRNATMADVPAIAKLEIDTWGKDSAASSEMIRSRIETYPEGNVVAVAERKIVGFVSVMRVWYNYEEQVYSWYEITNHGLVKGKHDPAGDCFFGVDLSVHPEFQKQGIGRKLLETVGKLAIRENVKEALLGGRLPDYHLHQDIPIEHYVFPPDGTIIDSELRFYLKGGLIALKIIPNYFKDPDSLDYGVLLSWKNPFYDKWYRHIAARCFRI